MSNIHTIVHLAEQQYHSTGVLCLKCMVRVSRTCLELCTSSLSIHSASTTKEHVKDVHGWREAAATQASFFNSLLPTLVIEVPFLWVRQNFICLGYEFKLKRKKKLWTTMTKRKSNPLICNSIFRLSHYSICLFPKGNSLNKCVIDYNSMLLSRKTTPFLPLPPLLPCCKRA